QGGRRWSARWSKGGGIARATPSVPERWRAVEGTSQPRADVAEPWSRVGEQVPPPDDGRARPVAEHHPADHDGHTVRPRVVGDELVVGQYPPPTRLRTDGALDDQQVRTRPEACHHHVT